ncbi:hypothetical protein ACFFGF_03900 [Asaia lannensis]|uniref:Uncharacterized protein n=1 Tax=Asaia lannensis NBRC 102526 TaxID=1307926 RepID=A0ABT1CH74_9PROT|nr:hypothetical protein [Asaia lannensis]MCO6160086.1 hypothetical protein [Asaia lannensis NBRC 102526]
MNRHFKSLVAVLLLASPSVAMARQGPVASPRYADGTGNSMIDQLNSSQLNNNYKGPYYHRGEAPPPFRPVQVAPPPPPPPPPLVRHHRHRPHPVPPGVPQPVMQPGGPH